jgi:two-component system sensor histidine kinase ArlS
MYFSATAILLVGVMLMLIYWLFAEYREEEFQQRQKEKILSTLHFVTEIEKNENELIDAIDRLNLNSLLNEKLLIFDDAKKLVYASHSDVPLSYSNSFLEKLNQQHVWIEQKEGLYDVVAIFFTSQGKSYYGLSKAYDEFGYTKLSFLSKLLSAVFLLYSSIVIVLSIYIANRIASPISELASLLETFRMGDNVLTVPPVTNTLEIDFLHTKFNELVKRTNEAYVFQKYAIQHISHQLKTPIAVIISELERIKSNADNTTIQRDISQQIEKTKSLADLINTLLEISKIESGQVVEKSMLRIDEILFDCIDELNTLHPDFRFDVHYVPDSPDVNSLTIEANDMLIRQVFQNILNNCIIYSNQPLAEIKIDGSSPHTVKISVLNQGKPISKEEEKYLFNHFFRGDNSYGKMGFGLGLSLTKKIVSLHNGFISYRNPSPSVNVFEVQFNSG